MYLASEQLVPIGHRRPDQCQAIHPAWHEQEARSFPRQTNPQGDDLHVQNQPIPRPLRTKVTWSLSKRNQRHSYVCWNLPDLQKGANTGFCVGCPHPQSIPTNHTATNSRSISRIDHDRMLGVPSWFFPQWLISMSMLTWYIYIYYIFYRYIGLKLREESLKPKDGIIKKFKASHNPENAAICCFTSDYLCSHLHTVAPRL